MFRGSCSSQFLPLDGDVAEGMAALQFHHGTLPPKPVCGSLKRVGIGAWVVEALLQGRWRVYIIALPGFSKPPLYGLWKATVDVHMKLMMCIFLELGG